MEWFSLSCNIWPCLLSSSSAGRMITVWWSKEHLWHISRAYFSPLPFLSSQSFVFTPCYLLSFYLLQNRSSNFRFCYSLFLFPILIFALLSHLLTSQHKHTCPTPQPLTTISPLYFISLHSEIALCVLPWTAAPFNNAKLLLKSVPIWLPWLCTMIIFSCCLSSTDPSRFYWWKIQNIFFYLVSFIFAFKLSQATLTCKFKFNYF